MKAAVLLNKDQYTVQSLSVEQCQNVISIFKDMQRARDDEILRMLKPFTTCLDDIIPRLKVWSRMCEKGGSLRPHAELFFKLESFFKTDMGMKLGSYLLERDALMAIEASNKIFRALAIEKKYLGLSKPMTLLKHNVQKLMAQITKVMTYIIKARNRVPGSRFFPSDKLDASKGQVILKKGVAFYVDPRDDDLVVSPPKHPLTRLPGSEWNKWFKIPPPTFTGTDPFIKIHIQDAPFRHLRQQFEDARATELINVVKRAQSAPAAGNLGNENQVRIPQTP